MRGIKLFASKAAQRAVAKSVRRSEIEKGAEDQRYEVTVWNTFEGDIVRKLWDATAEEVEETRERYADEPFYDVQVVER